VVVWRQSEPPAMKYRSVSLGRASVVRRDDGDSRVGVAP